ncbi:MAG: HPr family phosphocarrier protein [Eubacteriales bacterium]|jgi:phosphocarrier protein|nr:HPr family phosphocarrier protein [Lachnospiraceae bacterium]MDD5859931.1 HPr family phosphocarrier protein [Eubacteriales bacterium]MCH4064248.1 HPr family phosphocarrier protein [Lachnospiraceae bacterium]MCH4103027.1 HPr family phosphocarrier protein [Lachnospiraceae bacterium]MCI1308828.1 HPr family phosphocarrier protein [Lachnospiraceae bacterium]
MTFTYLVNDPKGMHARPAGVMAATAKEFASDITVEYGGEKVDMKKILPLMGLPMKKGGTFTVTIEGEDAEAAEAAIRRALNDIDF